MYTKKNLQTLRQLIVRHYQRKRENGGNVKSSHNIIAL
jgi:hypothetical protein